MTRSHFVKSARKDYPSDGIQKGDSYWYWEFAFNPRTYRSKSQPKQSQLTQSEYFRSAYEFIERAEEFKAGSSLETDTESLIEDIDLLAEDCEDRRSNMPDQLQDAPSGELLQNRADALRDLSSTLGSIDFTDGTSLEDYEIQDCSECDGSGSIPSDEGETTCPECTGTGLGEDTREEDVDERWESLLGEVQDALSSFSIE